MWPDIKQAYPDAELSICYGWNLFNIGAQNNPERQLWKKSVETMMLQPGIIHHGRVGKEELAKVRSSCGIWAYSTDFEEINCITALECASDGVVPVTMALAALKETAKEGILIEGDIKDEKIQKIYLKELLSLMGDKEKWNKLSLKCKKFANKYYWPTIANKWVDYFKEPITMPKVSIILPTIREGWWRIQAENMANQTYKNLEWIIVDDYKEDRSEIAKKYAKLYNLDIKYIRGDKATGKYNKKIALVRANNLGWKNATGELCVWIQDFILIPDNGIEQLVDLYRHNEDALIAPVDIYYDCLPVNMENKEDWWEGQENVLTEETWRNIRVKNEGVREEENAFAFEMNYGAIPRKILEELNGWWEFMDDGLGYDNTEIAYRALKLGYRLIIDDSNIASCINLWPIIGGLSQNIASRGRVLNPPRYEWLVRKTNNGELPIIRDEKLDATISLPFEIPKEVEDKDCADWVMKNTLRLVEEWNEGILPVKS
jgi:glycosyltransferase involved in cell wall biosynthesis